MNKNEWPELKVDLGPIRENRSLMIATPAYGGNCHVNYNLSVWGLETLLMAYGIAHNHIVTYNDPYVSFARNRLTQLFLESEYTDLLFIDADVEFHPADVIGLLHFDKDVIGGTYPRKEIDWATVRRIVRENPEIDPEELSIASGVFTTGSVSETMKPFEPTKTLELATGFMLIKRSTFEKVAPFCQRYKAEKLNAKRKEPQGTSIQSEWITDFFPSGVIGEQWVGDDFQFCRKVTEAGLDIHVCSWMEIAHHGTYRFPGNMHMAWQYKYKSDTPFPVMHSSGIPYGWMIPEEITWLEKMGQGRSMIVEIGSWLGQSTKALAKGGAIVLAVDTWEGSPEHQELLRDKPLSWLFHQFRDSVKDCKNIVPLCTTSIQAAEIHKANGTKFDLIFIDGAHDYESVKQDIEAWSPLLAKGGVLCGHDACDEGVQRALDELFPKRYSLIHRMWVLEIGSDG